jgi:HEPN domain-containing protein/predicted nucleotidyltransferase
MSELRDEWVRKAEEDAAVAAWASGAGHYDAACIHAQQVVEKYLMALLVVQGREFPKPHALRALFDLTGMSGGESDLDELRWLTREAGEIRYPGESARREDAERAVAIMDRWRSRLRDALGLSDKDRRRAFSEEMLREIVRRIVEAVQPERIILFGSAARGEMGPDSDVDLLIIKQCENRRETARLIRRELIGISVPIDIIVVTPDDIARHKDTIGLIYRPALREGKLVYAA